MSYLSKILKNVHSEPIRVLGAIILPDETLQIEHHDESDYVVNAELIQNITDGKIRVGNGVSFFTNAAEGLTWFLYSLRPAVNTFFENAEIRNNGFESKNVQDAIQEIGPDSVLGSMFKIDFRYNGSANNKWLDFASDSLPSNETMCKLLWKSKLVGVAYQNSEDDSDVKINVWRVPEDEGLSKDLVWSKELYDARCARYSNIDTIIFNVGDRIAVFTQDRGRNAMNVVVSLYFKIIKASKEDYVEYYNGDLSGGSV